MRSASTTARPEHCWPCAICRSQDLAPMPSLDKFLLRHSIHTGRVEDLRRHHVGIHVGSRAAILKIALAVSLGLTRDADRCTAVGDPEAELFDRRRLVGAGEAPLVARAVDLDVVHVLLLELLDRSHNLSVAAIVSHLLGGVIGVATGPVPIARDGLGVEADIDPLGLTHADQQVPGHPEMVAAVDTLARANLVFPLPWHHFGVDAGNVNPSVEAGFVVSFHDRAPEGTICACAAIVWTLRPRETT